MFMFQASTNTISILRMLYINATLAVWQADIISGFCPRIIVRKELPESSEKNCTQNYADNDDYTNYSSCGCHVSNNFSND